MQPDGEAVDAMDEGRRIGTSGRGVAGRERTLERWAAGLLAPLGVAWPGMPPRPQSVVVGVDGSYESYHAIRWATLLAERVHLVAAADGYRLPTDPVTGLPADRVIGRLREDASLVLREARPLVESVWSTEVVADTSPAQALMRRSRQTDADLIVVGHSSKGLVGRVLLGSTAESLTHRSAVPVLVCRGLPDVGPVVGGVGPDASSAFAAAWTIGLASWLGEATILAHATPDAESTRVPPQPVRAPEPFVQFRPVAWPPRAGLAELAAECRASVLVVGHGGRPGWLGSQAIALVRHAPCSVLVARPWDDRELAGRAVR